MFTKETDPRIGSGDRTCVNCRTNGLFDPSVASNAGRSVFTKPNRLEKPLLNLISRYDAANKLPSYVVSSPLSLNGFSDKILRGLSRVGGWIDDTLHYPQILNSSITRLILPSLTSGNTLESASSEGQELGGIYSKGPAARVFSILGKAVNTVTGLGDALVGFHHDYESGTNQYAETLSRSVKTVGQLSAGSAAAYALGGLAAAAGAPALATGALIIGGGALAGYSAGKLYDWASDRARSFPGTIRSAVDTASGWF